MTHRKFYYAYVLLNKQGTTIKNLNCLENMKTLLLMVLE